VEHGSVIVGLMEEMKKKRSDNGESDTQSASGDAGARYSVFVSLDRGLSLLVETLKERIGADCIKMERKAIAIARRQKGYLILLEGGDELFADAVILALPAGATAELLRGLDPQLSSTLQSIEYASSVVLNLVYRRHDIPDPLDGFGFVVPAMENRNILAVSYASVKFPNRAPEGMACLRVFLGGALRAEAAALKEEKLLDLARRDLKHYLRIKAAPIYHRCARYIEAMPQYHVGHKDLVERVSRAVSSYPGLALAGNAYSGVGLPDCIRSGEEAAQRVIEGLKSSVT
jgi:oxygen-dependent protoporphyrinogen oxidase